MSKSDGASDLEVETAMASFPEAIVTICATSRQVEKKSRLRRPKVARHSGIEIVHPMIQLLRDGGEKGTEGTVKWTRIRSFSGRN